MSGIPVVYMPMDISLMFKVPYHLKLAYSYSQCSVSFSTKDLKGPR